MKILPRVYRVHIVYYRIDRKCNKYKYATNQPGWVVARSYEGAMKSINKWPKLKYKYTVQLLEESWLKNVLSLLLPKFKYNPSGEWIQTK